MHGVVLSVLLATALPIASAGAGEACILVSCPALVGQEAPAGIRGSIIGLMGLSGAVGVLLHSKVAGLLFDCAADCAVA